MTSDSKKTGSRRTVAITLSILLALAFLFSSLPAAAFAQNNCARTHTVAAGDTLSALSVTYDISIQEIAAANSLQEPYALFVGQQLCIPGAAAAASTPAATTTPAGSGTTTTAGSSTATAAGSSSNPDFSITVGENLITLSATNLPKKNSFYVKVSESGFRNLDWTKVGRMRTTKDSGSATASFKLPKGLRMVKFITVCLKNATSDAILCRKAATGVGN